MEDSILHQSLRDILTSSDEIGSAWLLQAAEWLGRYRDMGGTQPSAILLLESLRYEQDEGWEDRVLEVLDIAYGFCKPELRTW
ncbi:MAG: hypothetical protein SF053_21790 [Bacteroidia bacterium]|nr:hypothetical protein [Bacteroidia bacterium]